MGQGKLYQVPVCQPAAGKIPLLPGQADRGRPEKKQAPGFPSACPVLVGRVGFEPTTN